MRIIEYFVRPRFNYLDNIGMTLGLVYMFQGFYLFSFLIWLFCIIVTVTVELILEKKYGIRFKARIVNPWRKINGK